LVHKKVIQQRIFTLCYISRKDGLNKRRFPSKEDTKVNNKRNHEKHKETEERQDRNSSHVSIDMARDSIKRTGKNVLHVEGSNRKE